MASFTLLPFYSLTKNCAVEIRLLNYPTRSLGNLASSSSIILRKYKWRIFIFDIHMPLHRNIITNYSQQDAPFLEFISTDALHVSGGSSAHHQEHITVHTASGIVNQYCC